MVWNSSQFLFHSLYGLSRFPFIRQHHWICACEPAYCPVYSYSFQDVFPSMAFQAYCYIFFPRHSTYRFHQGTQKQIIDLRIVCSSCLIQQFFSHFRLQLHLDCPDTGLSRLRFFQFSMTDLLFYFPPIGSLFF